MNFAKSTWEEVLEECLRNLNIKDAVWISTKDEKRVQVYFPIELYENDSTLGYLNSMGFGMKKGTSVGFMPFSLFYQDEEVDEFADDIS